MNILIVAATSNEIEPSLLFLKSRNIDVLVTGVGMVETAFSLGQTLHGRQYDLLVNVGVAGSFSPTLQIGDVVEVVQDQLIELGAEDHEQFLTIEDIGMGKSVFISRPAPELQQGLGLEQVHAVTVNTVHGNAESIRLLSLRMEGVTVESMEGAAVFFAAEKHGAAALQVRAISNYVEARDTSRWDIPLAVRHLNEWIQRFIDSVQEKH